MWITTEKAEAAIPEASHLQGTYITAPSFFWQMVCLMRKRWGKVCVCWDFRYSINVAVNGSLDVPMTDQNSSCLGGTKWFRGLDPDQFFWQTFLTWQEQPMTAFASKLGIFYLKRLPLVSGMTEPRFKLLWKKTLFNWWQNRQLGALLQILNNQCRWNHKWSLSVVPRSFWLGTCWRIWRINQPNANSCQLTMEKPTQQKAWSSFGMP